MATITSTFRLDDKMFSGLKNINSEMNNVVGSSKKAGEGFTVMKGLAVHAFTAIASAAKNAIGDVIGLTDQTTTQTARLAMVNDGLQTQVALQESIYQAAQRARAPYAEMMNTVAKLNLLAGDAFSTNKEATAYAELLAKSFKVAGTDTAAQVGATRQLVQALGSGVLRGDELNSVFEAAPNIIRNIADYLEVPIGKIRDMAGDGQITADIVKASMFAAADDINAKFSEMPMTIGEIGTSVKNVLLKAFTPALQAIGEGARYIYDNWERIAPVFVGITTAVAALAIGWGIYTAATWLAVAANQALIISFLTNPITLIAVAIGIVIGLIYKWVQSVGGLEIAWDIVVDALMFGWDIIKVGFFAGVFYVQNLMDKMGLGVSKAAAGIAGFFGDMKVNVLTILENMVNGAIDIINKLISKVSNIPGINIKAIEHVTFASTAAAENEAAKQARTRGIATQEAGVAARAAEREASIRQMSREATAAHEMRQAGIATKQAAKAMEKAAESEGMSLDGLTETTSGGKALKTKNVDKLITDEDIKLLADVATRDYQLNYRQITPNVKFGDMYINNDMDADSVIERFATAMEEMAASNLVVSHG